MPEVKDPDGLGLWRVSELVLILTITQRVHLARYRVYPETEGWKPVWELDGRDGLTLDPSVVVAWTPVPEWALSTTRSYRRLGNHYLRNWLHVEIEDKDEHKCVTFVSRFHDKGRFPVTWNYSLDLDDSRVLNDPNLIKACLRMFGEHAFKGSIKV